VVQRPGLIGLVVVVVLVVVVLLVLLLLVLLLLLLLLLAVVVLLLLVLVGGSGGRVGERLVCRRRGWLRRQLVSRSLQKPVRGVPTRLARLLRPDVRIG